MISESTVRTVVVGSGVSGCLAARVCADAGHDVTLVDRRPVGAASAYDAQLHNLLGRAQRHLQQLVPGFREKFVQSGGQVARVSAETRVHELGVDMPRRDLGLEIWSASKSAIDDVVAVDRDRVTHRFGLPVTGLVVEGRRVRGVRCGSRIIEADLVIDATGSGTLARSWTGAVAVPETILEPRQWYVTTLVDRPKSSSGRPDFYMLFPTSPGTRGGLISPASDETWRVSVSGGGMDDPPRTWEEVLAYAHSLERPWFGDLLMNASPLGPPAVFRRPVARWRHNEQSDDLPDGLLALGDAVVTLNPLQGQGISVAAWHAAEFAEVLAQDLGIEELTREHRARAATGAAVAWDVMTLFGPAPTGPALSDVDWAEIRALVRDDAEAHRAYVEVWHLLRPASALLGLLGRTGTLAL